MKSESKNDVIYRVWISTTGYYDEYYKSFLKEKTFCLTDSGHDFDFSKIATIEEFRNLIGYHISNHYNFSKVVKKGDYLLLIRKKYDYKKRNGITYTLCKFVGGYQYLPNNKLKHGRAIEVILEDVPKLIFTDRLQALLRNGFFYRSTKKIDEEIINTIKAYSYFLVKAGRIDEQTFKKVQRIKLTKS